MVTKIRAALDARTDADLVIIARTDAKETLGLAEVIARLNRYAQAGADVVFAAESYEPAELRVLGAEVETTVAICAGVPGWPAAFETRDTYAEWGLGLVIYPFVSLYPAVQAMKGVYSELASHGGLTQTAQKRMVTFAEFNDFIGVSNWMARESSSLSPAGAGVEARPWPGEGRDRRAVPGLLSWIAWPSAVLPSYRAAFPGRQRGQPVIGYRQGRTLVRTECDDGRTGLEEDDIVVAAESLVQQYAAAPDAQRPCTAVPIVAVERLRVKVAVETCQDEAQLVMCGQPDVNEIVDARGFQDPEGFDVVQMPHGVQIAEANDERNAVVEGCRVRRRRSVAMIHP